MTQSVSHFNTQQSSTPISRCGGSLSITIHKKWRENSKLTVITQRPQIQVYRPLARPVSGWMAGNIAGRTFDTRSGRLVGSRFRELASGRARISLVAPRVLPSCRAFVASWLTDCLLSVSRTLPPVPFRSRVHPPDPAHDISTEQTAGNGTSAVAASGLEMARPGMGFRQRRAEYTDTAAVQFSYPCLRHGRTGNAD